MKIDDIDAFVAVIRCQSISHAAEALQLTQPAITRRVQNFEQSLGVELFDRNTKPLKPTVIGTQVYEQCRNILREMDALREMVASDAPPSGVLRLGVPQPLGDVVLPQALGELKRSYAELRTQVLTDWGDALVHRVAHGELDAAVAMFPAGKVFPDNLVGTSLGTLDLVVVGAASTALKRSSRLAEVFEQGWVLSPEGCGQRAGLQRALNQQGLGLKVNLETFGTELQLALVADGQGLGLVPRELFERSAHRSRLAVLALKDFKPAMDLWLLHPRFLGNLQGAVAHFGALVSGNLWRARDAA